MDTEEFRDIFAAEAKDYLQALNEDVLALEREPKNQSLLDSMFRSAHSLKGMSGTMGYEALANFTHQMENVLDLLRTHELDATTEIINALFAAVDHLEVLLEMTLLGMQTPSNSEVASTLQAIISQDAPDSFSSSPDVATEQIHLDEYDKESIKQSQTQGYAAYTVTIRLRETTLLKSVRVYTIFQALESFGTIIKSQPSAQELEDEKFDFSFALILLTHETKENIIATIETISEVEQVSASLFPLDTQYSQQEEIEAVNDEAVPVTPTVDKGKSTLADKFVRVETDRLDILINLVGELVISRTQVLEMTKTIEQSEAKNTIVQLDRVTTDLQYAAMKLRMVPIKQVFDRFPRMVRDLAQAKEKPIELVLFGEDTELDRSIVNQIGDPLVHLIRNSVDHGIESHQQRLTNGKPELGTITLSARHEGSHVLIELSDDGQGVNVARVREKACAKGLLPADYKGELSLKEAINLLFEPGFSTSDSVTDVSGRGVGMDAVKANVESLNGIVEMESTPGLGSKVTIRLPLTLAIIKALLVVVHGQTYAIPLQSVRENLLVTDDQIKPLQQHQAILLRNEILPLMDLAEVLGFSHQAKGSVLSVIVTETQGEKVGLIVDELIGQQEIVIKSLSTLLGEIPGIAGATVLGDGRVALILDCSTLIKNRSEDRG